MDAPDDRCRQREDRNDRQQSDDGQLDPAGRTTDYAEPTKVLRAEMRAKMTIRIPVARSSPASRPRRLR